MKDALIMFTRVTPGANGNGGEVTGLGKTGDDEGGGLEMGFEGVRGNGGGAEGDGEARSGG